MNSLIFRSQAFVTRLTGVQNTKKLIVYAFRYTISIVPLQLKFSTGHREVHPLGMLSTQALSPTLRYYEGGMEGMGEMGCLVLVGLKDREESKE